MRKAILSLIIIQLFISLNQSGFAQTISKNLDHFYTALAADHEMNGNVLAAQNGKVLYSHSFGFSNAADNRANTVNSQFELASVSKVFTATAVLQLKDKGSIGLDIPFQHYFPAFPYADITV